MSFLVAAWSLAWRELVRFGRQRSRVAGALATPLVFWFLIGSGLGRSFQPPGAPEGVGSLEFFFPGTLLLVVLFTAVFATMSIIEDRHAGFLQSVLVAPVGRGAIVLGKVAGGAMLALVQVVPLLLLAPLAGLHAGPAALGATAGVLAIVALGLTALGFALAWRIDSTQGFHAVLNLVLVPMWMLSGAFFPQSGAPAWLRGLMAVNPMTYALAALRRCLYAQAPEAAAVGRDLPSLGASLAVTVVFAAAAFAVAVRLAGRTSAGDLR